MSKSIVKIYGDGEFWVDGKRKAKIYSDGQIYSNNQKIGNLYEDGEIWIDHMKVGNVYEDGEVWIGNKKVASGIYLLDLLHKSPSSINKDSNTSYSATFMNSNAKSTSTRTSSDFGFGFVFVSALLIFAFVYACFALWMSELPQIFFDNFGRFGKLAMICIYGGMFFVMYCVCRKQSHQYKGQKVGLANLLSLAFEAVTSHMVMFFACVVIFTVLNVTFLAIEYGATLTEAIGVIISSLSTGIFGLLFVLFAVALAPSLVGAVISIILIKKRIKL